MFTFREYEELDARTIDDQYLVAQGEALHEAKVWRDSMKGHKG